MNKQTYLLWRLFNRHTKCGNKDNYTLLVSLNFTHKMSVIIDFNQHLKVPIISYGHSITEIDITLVTKILNLTCTIKFY